MSYATTSDVQARDPYRTISVGSKPSEAQVTAWITETEALLNSSLRAAQIYSDSFGADALAILKSWTVDRVSGLVRMAYAAAGGDGANKDGQDLVDAFAALLKEIRMSSSFYGAMLLQGSAPDAARRLRGYVLDNIDDQTVAAGDFAPTFTKSAAGDQF